MYAAVSEFNAGAGIEITASHNPIDYNGMKLINKGAQPLSNEEFSAIKSLAEAGKFGTAFGCGSAISVEKEARDCYLRKIISFVNPKLLQPIKIVINSGNGAAGPTSMVSDELKTWCKNQLCICTSDLIIILNGIYNLFLKKKG